MEIGDFIWYLLMTMILFVPLAWNYFILYMLNWNQRRNLFLDSWIVFITWFVSSLVVLLVFLIAFAYSSFTLFNPVAFFLLLAFSNIFSIVAILTSRTKRELSITDVLSEKANSKIDVSKIWQTSVIVTFLNYAMIISLIMFVSEVSTKTRKQETPKSNLGISF